MTPTKAEELSDWLFAFASGKAESIMLCRAAAELRRLSAVEAERDALLAAKAVPADLRSAAERTRQDLGPTGSNYPDVRVLLAFVEQALAAHTPPAPDCED